MNRRLPFPVWVPSLLLCFALLPAGPARGQVDTAQARAWIEQMKQSPRGPFARIRWFCNDGSVLPPEPYACVGHGGGAQHGEWSQYTRALRAGGYRIATLYADLDIDELVSGESLADNLGQMLIEQFLIRIDDGWILRGARFYRGAFQEEGERKGARRLLLRLFADPGYVDSHFLQLRTAASLLPHGADTDSIQSLRLQVTNLASRDPGFSDLRTKIHTRPDPRDAQRVEEYARRVGDPELRRELSELAAAIRRIYARRPDTELDALQRLADRGNLEELAATLRTNRAGLGKDRPPQTRFEAAAAMLEGLRAALPRLPTAADRLHAMDASIAVEAEYFIAARQLTTMLSGRSRRHRLQALGQALPALYGAGLISERERQALETSLAALLRGPAPDASAYQQAVQYLALPTAWSVQHYRFHFGRAQARLAAIEPEADLFIQDQVRGGPLFSYALLIDPLLRDAQRLTGRTRRLFGRDAGVGLRALNPGLARGVLLDVKTDQDREDLRRDGIYLLPETTADLPPVAGILTTGEGNPLSHVQLLARNLGIPNVSIDAAVRDRLRPHLGEAAVMAVSPGGAVVIDENRGQWDAYFERPGEPPEAGFLIRPDLDKLDLQTRRLIPLGELQQTDSGRVVGPKAANLGELKRHYPQAVADGLAIPFGVFRELLDGSMPGTGRTVFQWLVDGYRRIEALPAGSPERDAALETLRSRLYEWLLHADPGADFRQRLRRAMQETFGGDGGDGVFVRSDTNVEDLPGFTGAGLNLTLPNVIGFDAVCAALNRVWASPFTARAFAWRQARMQRPEYVFPAILLLRAVNVDKSGVMVTEDIETGDPRWISVAVNEGVGGAVEGQAAEALRISLDDGRVRLMAQATAPQRRQLDPRGGLETLTASGRDYVLKSDEIRRLAGFARNLPAEFPARPDDAGNPVPFDVEFGFLDGRLYLFQIRPYLENRRTRANALLRSLDAGGGPAGPQRIDLDTAPDGGKAGPG